MQKWLCFLCLTLCSILFFGVEIYAQEDAVEVTGTITTQSGDPMGGVMIHIDSLITVKSNRSGQFSCRLPRNYNPKHINISKLGWGIATWEYKRHQKKIQIFVEKRRFVLSGSIQNTNSQPIAGAKIGIQGKSIETVSKSDGTFSLIVPPSLEIAFKDNLFTVDGKPIPKTSFILDAIKQTILIRLIKNQIFGVIIKNESGKPMSGITVLVGSKSYQTDPVGKIQFEHEVMTTSDNIQINDWKILAKTHNPTTREVLVTIQQAGIELNNPATYQFANQPYPKYNAPSPNTEALHKNEQEKRMKHHLFLQEVETFTASIEPNEINEQETQKAKIYLNQLHEFLTADNHFKLLTRYQNSEKKLTHLLGISDVHENPKSQEETFKEKVTQNLFVAVIPFVLLLASIFGIFRIRKRYQQKVKAQDQKIHQLEKEVSTSHQELTERNHEIKSYGEHLKTLHEQVHRNEHDLTSNIQYAQTIQSAILPTREEFTHYFTDIFILYLPKSIVSGDFYWLAYSKDKTKVFVAVVDCTGHGVAGAFMSMIGTNILNVIYDEGIELPQQMLIELNHKIRTILKQDRSFNNDGMDLGLCAIQQTDTNHFKVQFTGAKRPLIYAETYSKTVHVLKGDNKSIGGRQRSNRQFTNQEIHLIKGDILYLTTDGLMDQGDPTGNKFGMQNLINTLKKGVGHSLETQKNIVEDALRNHQQETRQRDDITIMGIQL